MKLNRNSKKWKEIYNQRVQENFRLFERAIISERGGMQLIVSAEQKIKEAEEYADRLFSAMR